MSQGTSTQQQEHWRRTRNLMIVHITIWFIFSFVVHWLAPELNRFTFNHFPLGFYFTAQGSLIAFVVMIFVQNWFQDKIDDEFGFHEEE